MQLPILRKDFIIDEYQLYQARIVGADAILLIAAALKKEQCKALALKAHELELEVLLEIHNEQELEYIDENIDMVESTTVTGKLPHRGGKLFPSGGKTTRRNAPDL